MRALNHVLLYDSLTLYNYTSGSEIWLLITNNVRQTELLAKYCHFSGTTCHNTGYHISYIYIEKRWVLLFEHVITSLIIFNIIVESKSSLLPANIYRIITPSLNCQNYLSPPIVACVVCVEGHPATPVLEPVGVWSWSARHAALQPSAAPHLYPRTRSRGTHLGTNCGKKSNFFTGGLFCYDKLESLGKKQLTDVVADTETCYRDSSNK